MDEKNKTGVTVIAATDDTPSVIMDLRNFVVRIEGASFPEDAVDFYTPVLEWVKKLGNEFEDEFVCDFDFTILSSASNKMIFELLIKMEKLHLEGCKVKVNWFYESFDEDMFDEGKGFKEGMKMPFELIEK